MSLYRCMKLRKDKDTYLGTSRGTLLKPSDNPKNVTNYWNTDTNILQLPDKLCRPGVSVEPRDSMTSQVVAYSRIGMLKPVHLTTQQHHVFVFKRKRMDSMHCTKTVVVKHSAVGNFLSRRKHITRWYQTMQPNEVGKRFLICRVRIFTT